MRVDSLPLHASPLCHAGKLTDAFEPIFSEVVAMVAIVTILRHDRF